jgi:adenylosuccinate synthase
VGKTAFGDALVALFGALRLSTKRWLLAETGCENDPDSLQRAGASQDAATGGAWVAKVVEDAIANGPCELLLLDAARIKEQVRALQERYGDRVFHVHLNADPAVLERRYAARKSELKEYTTYAEAQRHGTEAQVGTLATIADAVLETSHSGAETLAVTTMAMLGTHVKKPERLVDVIVGGQFGSEGKGNICAKIAKDYGALMRIGGPNAGHRVFDPPYKYVQLPSGTGSNGKALVLIGAGSTLWLPTLLKEICDHGLTGDRLAIDPQAMVIDDWDRRAEAGGLSSIATTKQGVGAASARKIANRGDPPMLGPAVRLARDVPELAEYVRNVREELDRLYRAGRRVLLEGTQGTALSIHHGPYPHVTSRETSVSGCLADAGISHLRAARVIMVVRTFPIRVGGPSGWMGRELEWQDVSGRSGIPVEELVEAEKGTVSNRLRRIAEFDWGQLRRAAELNGASEIALSFADYLGVANRDAVDFPGLNETAQRFIRRVEAVAGVPVTMVSKAFAKGGVIERGTWS